MGYTATDNIRWCFLVFCEAMLTYFHRSGLAGPLYLWLAILAVSIFAPVMEPLLVYDRAAIARGEIWRLLSGHLTHTNLPHLLLNGAGLGLLWVLHGVHYRIWHFLGAVIVIGLGVGLGLFYGFPQTQVYLGFSGVLHGLIVWGGILDIRARWITGYLLVAGTWVKIGWEQWAGASAATSRLIDAVVAVDAHFLGALAGTLLGIAGLLARRQSPGHRVSADAEAGKP